MDRPEQKERLTWVSCKRPFDDPWYQDRAATIVDSYRRLLGRELLPEASFSTVGKELARAVWEAPIMVVSHDPSADPEFVFANRTALSLFQIEAIDFVGMKSRLSAETALQAERAELLREVLEKGYSESYSGVRIGRLGRRFRLHSATVFNLIDESSRLIGQAAAAENWEFLSEP